MQSERLPSVSSSSGAMQLEVLLFHGELLKMDLNPYPTIVHD